MVVGCDVFLRVLLGKQQHLHMRRDTLLTTGQPFTPHPPPPPPPPPHSPSFLYYLNLCLLLTMCLPSSSCHCRCPSPCHAPSSGGGRAISCAVGTCTRNGHLATSPALHWSWLYYHISLRTEVYRSTVEVRYSIIILTYHVTGSLLRFG